MATTATISLNSNITGDTLSLSSTATLTKAKSNSTNLDQFTGVNTIKYAATQSAITFIDAGDYVDTEVSHKVYIRNAVLPSASSSAYVLVDIDSGANEPLGRLYPGDWCFFPWLGTLDIDITTNEVGTTVEYAVISQSVVSA
tara:strand:+ start:586 stop:1011 length:426 start_codon:yes stop_codon:yes gene_type:complete